VAASWSDRFAARSYLYDRDTISSDNHEAFVRGWTIVRSPEVDALLET
jgi:hypothetical protein